MSSVRQRLQAAINNEQQKNKTPTQLPLSLRQAQSLTTQQPAQKQTVTLPTAQTARTLARSPTQAMGLILQTSLQNQRQEPSLDELKARMDEARQTANEMSRMESSGMTYDDFQALQIPGSERFKRYRNASEARQAYDDIKDEYDSRLRDDYNQRKSAAAAGLESVRDNSDFQSVVNQAMGQTWRPGNIFTGNADARNVARDIQLLARQAEGRETDEVGDTAKNMTQEQRDTLMYYAGTNQWDMASEYLESIQREVNAKAAQAEMETAREYSQQHPILGAVGNAAAGLLTPISYLANAGNVIRNQITGEYTPTDINSNLFQGARLNQATQEGVTTAAQDMPILGDIEIGGRNLGSELAGVGLSIGQVLSRVPFGPAGALALAGGSAAGQQTYDTLASGGTEGQALAMSTAAGLIEAATEKIGIDRLFEVFGRTGRQGLRQVIRDVAIQAGIEGTEEAISEVANTIADNFIMGENSQYNQTVNRLMSQGVSREDARREAMNQVLQNVGWSAFGGALSGGLMGGGASAVNAMQNRVTLPTAEQGGRLPGGETVQTEQQRSTAQATGQNNTASTGETVINDYQRAEHHGEILDTVRANLQTVSSMQPVATITGREFQKSPSDTRNLRTKVIEFFNSIGNKVTRRDIGDIELNTSGVRDSLAHGYGRLKAATFAALPQVLEQGQMIAHNGPYEGHGYDSYIISAPVQVGNETVYVGALVIKDTNQRYKLHEVLTASQSGAPLFQSESTGQGADVPLRNDAPLGASEDAPTETSIPQGGRNVNPVIQRLSQALGRNIQMYDGSRESGTRGTANGYYSNGTIYVNSNTANPVAQVIAHELTHSVEMADAYQDLQNLIFERIQQTGGNLEQMRAQKADLYQRNGVNLNAQDLDAEIVAEYVEKNLLTDEASIQELTRTNRTLAQRIRDWIDSILAKLGNTDAQSRVFLERARDAYSRALQQTQGTVDTVATVDTVGSVASQRQVQSLLDQYDSGAITQEQLIERATRLLEGEADEQSSGNVNPKYSISEYTDQERQDHARTVLDHFGKTYSWNETGYITQDGSRVDLSGKHEGGPGGYRTVDHRDISDALGEDYGDGDYSGAMVQFISEGNIRISPESGGIDLSVQPTRAQEQALADFISRNRGEVILDIDRPNGDTVASVEYPRGTHSTKVINDIRNYFSDGTIPQVSEVSRFRYSLDENQRNQFVSMLRQYARGNWNEQTIQEYLNLVRQNGEYDQGANAARSVLVPQRDSEGNPVSRTARTAMGAKAIPESVASDIANLVRTGQMSYERVGDKASTQRAIQRIQNDGFDRSLEYFSQNARKGIVSKDMVTLGQQLLVNAANAGDGRRTAEILQLYTQMGTSIGQAEQAFSILRKLDPSDQLYAIQKTVSNLEEEIQKRFKDKNITIDPALLEEFQNQTDDAGRDAVKEKIYQNVADQIPSTWRDKWNAWRYMAMLTNPRTHIRNIVGNLGFVPVRMVKDAIATTLEAGANLVLPGGIQRTKAPLNPLSRADRSLVQAAFSDVQNVQEQLLGSGKYADSATGKIDDYRTIFKFKPLEAVRKGNSNLMEVEDAWFSNTAYAGALAGYLKANGVTAQQMTDGTVSQETLDAGRTYAIEEAQKATYRDANALSDFISNLRYRGSNPVGRAVNTVVEGIMPFRRTPANILMRGVEYSPVGLVNGVKEAVWDVHRGNKTAAEAIDDISAGLTGTGLLALGAWLASMGLVTGGGSGDDEQDSQNDLTGQQNYALTIWDKNFTLDWLAPEALPFFVGVEAYNVMSDQSEGGVTLDNILSAFERITDPMLEMSMLQGVQDAIETVQYADSGTLLKVAANAVLSYFTQALPTLFGQIERTTEDQRYTTFIDRTNGVPTDIQYTIGQALNKVPGVEFQQIPYIDAWGRTESNGGPFERAFNNFLNPAYTSTINRTAADEEIQRLLDAGQTGIVPDRVPQSQKVDGQYLTAEQYVEYATLKGQTSYDVVSEMIESELYQNMTDEEKADAIKRAYQYAGHVAAQAINPEHESESYVSGAQNAEEDFGLSEAEYLLMDRVYGKSGLERIKETMDSGVSMDTAIEVNNALDALEPKRGEDTVSNLQRYRAVVDNVSSVNQQLSVLKTVSTDSDYRKFVVGNNFGVSPSAYVTAREAMYRFDQPNDSGNLGTYTQAEIEAMLDSFPSSATLTTSGTLTLTNNQKAVLWQLISGSSSPKNNPYSYSVGQQVIDAVNEAKQSNNQSTTQTSQYSGLLNFLPRG